jgi:hypothetical protein
VIVFDVKFPFLDSRLALLCSVLCSSSRRAMQEIDSWTIPLLRFSSNTPPTTLPKLSRKKKTLIASDTKSVIYAALTPSKLSYQAPACNSLFFRCYNFKTRHARN